MVYYHMMCYVDVIVDKMPEVMHENGGAKWVVVKQKKLLVLE